MRQRIARQAPLTVVLATLLAVACRRDEPVPPVVPHPPTARIPQPSAFDPPSSAGSLAPRLSRNPDGGALLSWLEPTADGSALRWAAVDASSRAWAPAATVTASPRLLPNAADVPGIGALGNGRMVAHWRETREPAGDGYDARIALSFDSGRTWEEAVTPHRDGTDTEHGFVSVYEASTPDVLARIGPGGAKDRGNSGTSVTTQRISTINEVTDIAGIQSAPAGPAARDVTEIDAGLAWLDGRQAAASPHAFAAQLIATTLESGGHVGLGVEQVIDDRACECCPTSTARAGDVTLLAYRDRSADEIRDIAVVRRSPQGTWSQPIRVHEDAWHVVGCPVNGPALDADGRHAAIAWFTASQDDARVLLAFSDDAGTTWSEPVRVDDTTIGGQPAGHAGVALLADGSVLVTFVQRSDAGLSLQARRVVRGSAPGPALAIAQQVIGIPQVARAGSSVFVAWTERIPGSEGAVATDSRRVRCARWDAGALTGT